MENKSKEELIEIINAKSEEIVQLKQQVKKANEEAEEREKWYYAEVSRVFKLKDLLKIIGDIKIKEIAEKI